MAVLATSPVQLHLTLKAFVLNKDNLNSLEQWHPAQHVVTEGVEGGEVQQTISCNQPGFGHADDAAELLGGTSDFVFSGNASTKTSWPSLVHGHVFGLMPNVFHGEL